MKNWKIGIDYPEWMPSEGVKIVSSGYTLDNETPKQMYQRVAKAAATCLGKPEKEQVFFDYMWKGWLCPASPVLSNLGTDRGLPISCYGLEVSNSISSISGAVPELMKLSQLGGGVGIGIDKIQAKGTAIKRGGTSNGVMQFVKLYDSTIAASAQGGVRRGAASVNLNITHPDFYDFCKMRRVTTNEESRCEKLNHCVIINDKFMHTVLDDNHPNSTEYRKRWDTLLQTRQDEGQPYMMYIDNVNKANPLAYKLNGLDVKMTNICTEITQYTDDEHSFICALSSVNVAKWDEWKNTNLIYDCILFLEGVLNEFITKLKAIINKSISVGTEKELANLYLKKVLRSAEKGRSIGLGVLGWHTLLLQKELPFISIQSNALNKIIFKKMKTEADRASADLAIEFGEPLWCKGTGQRHCHKIAVAPTITNATIVGVTHTIEPSVAWIYAQISAKGTFIRINKDFEAFMHKYYAPQYTEDVKNGIIANSGSVAHLNFMSKEHKEILLTAYEINQKELINQSADRLPYICQAQSLNLFISENPNESSITKNNWIRHIHMHAWKKGIKTLYYMRADVVNKGDMVNSSSCTMCEA